MYVNSKFAALLPSPYSRVKNCSKFKTNIHLVSVDSFLYYLSSRPQFTISFGFPELVQNIATFWVKNGNRKCMHKTAFNIETRKYSFTFCSPKIKFISRPLHRNRTAAKLDQKYISDFYSPGNCHWFYL